MHICLLGATSTPGFVALAIQPSVHLQWINQWIDVITPSPPSHEDIDIDWDGDGVTLTQHPLLGLSPWDYEIYRSPAGYQPQDPEDHGGALYGEKLWVTAGAMNIDLGPDDGCCGKNDYGGCGHCVLIQNPNSLNHDWSVLAMKKNTGGIGYITWPHLDINVPGYDALEWSWANICGDKPNTGLTKAEWSSLGRDLV